MDKVPFGHRIGKVIAFALRPLTWPYGLWRRVERRNGVTYFVMPDTSALMLLYVAPCMLYLHVLGRHAVFIPLVVVTAPFVLVSVLRVRGGEVTYFKTVLLVPYWRKQVPTGSLFERYESWEDVAPTGVAFSLPPEAGEYLHLGTAGNADALYQSIGEALQAQGWVGAPGGALGRSGAA